jgi:hypothetical protein
MVVLLASSTLPLTVTQAASRISITSLYVTDTPSKLVNGKPANDSLVGKVTSNLITLLATVEGFTDSELTKLYVTITNVTTDKVFEEKGIVPQKQGTYDIAFRNVPLTEGLNKVVIKFAGTNIVESAPGWVYYVATTTINDLKINNEPFIEGKIYPNNTSQTTTVNLSGNAPNATEVKMQLYGTPAPVNGILNQGQFLFIADDVNNKSSVATIKLKPGDNPLTFIASNATKTFQTQRNLVYDNGKPFAFETTLKDSTNMKKPLAKTPVVVNSDVTLDSLLKVDLDSQSQPQYRYVELRAGNTRYGPYDLRAATPAERADALYPKTFYQGHSDTSLTITGSSLSTVQLFLESNDGTVLNESLMPLHTSTDGTKKVFALDKDDLDQKLLAARSPYTIRAKNTGLATVATFTLNVLTPGNLTLPTVTDATTVVSELEGATGTLTQKVLFSSAITDATPAMSIVITDVTGETVEGNGTNVTGYALNTTEVSYRLPSYLVEGTYKMRVLYGGYALTERLFTVGKKPPTAPIITQVSPNETYALGGTPTYIFVQGNFFGTNRAVVSAVLDNGTEQLTGNNLVLYDLTPTSAIFRLSDQALLDDQSSYALKLNVDTASVTYPAAIKGKTYTVGTNTDGKTVTEVTPLQVAKNTIGTSGGEITVTGTNLNNTTGTLIAQLLTESGTPMNNAIVTQTTPTTAKLQLPAVATGKYILRFTNTAYTTTATLAQVPIVVVEPKPTALTPNVRAVNAPESTADKALALTGLDLGRDMTKLKMRFIDRNTGNIVSEKVAESLTGGVAQFDAPVGLAKGIYTVTVLYNDALLEPSLQYTVSAPPATLREDATWSKPGAYRVYAFQEQLEISADRVQTLSFHFYNVPTDTNPPTAFTYFYENPNLPYIEQMNMTNGGSLLAISETTTNELNEQPASLVVVTNNRTNSLNYYVGAYTENTTPLKASFSGTEGQMKKFTVPLVGLPNGTVNVTLIPSVTADSVPATRVGENLVGKKVLSVRVSSTPYVVVNNVYSGIIVKDIRDFTCTTPSNTTLSPCLQGRLVNVPAAEYTNVEVYINETLFTMSNTTQLDDFLDDSPRFWFAFGPNSSRSLPSGTNNNLLEGKNKIRIVIRQLVNGVLTPVSEAVYDVFKFSGNAPDFLSIKPLETSDVVRYRTGTQENTYLTNESTVTFAGQFANATEIKLSVRTVDPLTGAPQTLSDRRYGTDFKQLEPITNSPNLFTTVNTPLGGQFATRAITLAPKGDTIFEFMITNSTNIIVTKTITVSREPLPYIVLNPKVNRNPVGIDQANINSNYAQFEIVAEGADKVMFNKDAATKREVVDPDTKQRRNHFFYEVRNLKTGTNTVNFIVYRGAEQKKGSVVLFHVNTSIEGAQYKTPIRNRLSVFNNALGLTFPKNTNLLRNDPAALNTYITVDRQILFGIASSVDGRIDKYRHPAASDGQVNNPNPLIPANGKLLLAEPTGRFRAVSPLYWIDAGTIPPVAPDVREALTGSGRHPYDEEVFYNRSLPNFVVPSEPGTLQIKYDSSIRDDGAKYLTVYHFDTYEDAQGTVGSRWRNIGGVVNATSNTITVPIERFGFYQVMYMNQSYDDIITHPWARDQLDTLYARGVMFNKTNTNFIPNEPITRGEFATLLVKVFDMPLQYTDTPSFSDVLRVNPLASGLYDYKYIETAAKAGIIRGQSGGRFMPDTSIDRQDAATMIARAADLKLDTNPSKVLAQIQKRFTDGAELDVYARPSILAVTSKKFIEGKPNALQSDGKKLTYRFDPEATFTRAEAAEVIIRVMKDQGKLPK